MTIDVVREKATAPVQQYAKNTENELIEQLQSLKSIYSGDFGEKTFLHWDLLNGIKTSNLEIVFSNLNVAVWMFSTPPYECKTPLVGVKENQEESRTFFCVKIIYLLFIGPNIKCERS